VTSHEITPGTNAATVRPFASRLAPAVTAGGFAMDDYWVWGASAIHADAPGEDGRYHLFAERWPRQLPAHPHWLTNADIVHAVADRPEGPYTFLDVALPAGGPNRWDGLAVMNPAVQRYGDQFLLFYIGVNYLFDPPDPSDPDTWLDLDTQFESRYKPAWNTKRIGIAVADSLDGPWRRPERPAILPRYSKWDAMTTSNPAPWVHDNGRIYLCYKSRPGVAGEPRMMLGMAAADSPDGPFDRLSDEPILRFDDPDQHVEDPCLWHEDGQFHLLCKDMTGKATGEWGAGIYAVSDDAVDWHFADPIKGYSRTVAWDDGKTRTHANFERPSLLMQRDDHGVRRPTHFLAAMADESEPWAFDRSWNAVIPLRD